jgi:hypothetical protein
MPKAGIPGLEPSSIAVYAETRERVKAYAAVMARDLRRPVSYDEAIRDALDRLERLQAQEEEAGERD